MRFLTTLLYCFFGICCITYTQSELYRSEKGIVHFISNAPLEIIEAKSERLKGIINPLENTYAFSLEITSFDGFNSRLQRTHFNESYLESSLHPTASFAGKIIEEIDWSEEGMHNVRAKGILQIHGVEQERIIKSVMTIEGGQIRIQANFTIPLSEHDISIPTIVAQKISDIIKVSVEIVFSKESLAN